MPPKNLLRQRHTKIVATLGPASSTREQIKALFETGVDVFRLNFSHGSHEDHAMRVQHIRSIEAELGRPISILADLQGPKLRLGKFQDGGIDLQRGMKLRLDLDPTPGNSSRVHLPHPELVAALDAGAELRLDDGKVRLVVTKKGKDYLDTEVLAGNRLSDRKGVNIPNVILPLDPLTDKDRKDLVFAVDLGVDWVALSFVQLPSDLTEARQMIAGRAALMVKLEKPSAIDHLDALIDGADGIMLARGDLGVEMPAEDVPSIQKRVVRAVRQAGKPVIVATQMLESMISSPSPTRAEASDVATAVFDGTDAVMLSAETASGEYPIEAVSIMDRIAKRVEHDPLYRTIMDAEHPNPNATAADAITAAARQVATTIGAAAIVTYTSSGSTTLRAARERPEVGILCLTSSEKTARRMALSYGVHPFVTPDIASFAEMVEQAGDIARNNDIAAVGQKLVITAGVPFGTPGSTNVLRISWIEGANRGASSKE